MSNKKATYKSHFQEVWLSELEYRNWLKKDKNDKSFAFCLICLKSFSVAAHGKKGLVLHASHEFHVSRLPTISQMTVKFGKDKPEEKRTFQKMRILRVLQVLVSVPAPLRSVLHLTSKLG